MPSDEQIWEHWLRWLPSAEPGDLPGPVFGQYRQALLAAGSSEADAGEQMAAILRLMGARPDAWGMFFNKIYASPSPGFNTEPNALLVSAVARRTAGRALDVCTGQGRNAVFLAVEGWDVTAVDVSDAGLAVAARNAASAGVTIGTVLASGHDFDFGMSAWDLIVLTYAPLPAADPAYVRRLRDALRPGGIIVIESFASDVGDAHRTPADLDPAELKRAWSSCRILHCADTIVQSDWDKKEMRTAQLIAEKPRDNGAG